MVQLCWDLYKQYGFINTVFWLDGANAAFTNLAKIKFNESLYWQKVKDFGKNSNVKIRPVSFGSESRTMLSNIHAVVAKGIFAVPEKYDKLLISMRTAYAEDLVLKKDVTSYDDLFDATRLALKGYNFK